MTPFEPLAITIYSNIKGSASTQTYTVQGTTSNYASNLLFADNTNERLYARNVVLNLSNLPELVHQFGSIDSGETILFVDTELGLILTTTGIYDDTSFELLVDLLFLSLEASTSILKAEKSIFIEVESDFYFVLDVQQFSGR